MPGCVVDPFCGGALLPYDRARALVAAGGHRLRPEHLRPHDPIDTLDRMLGNVRAWAARRPERARARLWSCELALLLPHHDLNLRREYAEALIAVGRYTDGAVRLEDYADLVKGPMPLEADRARRTARAGPRAAELTPLADRPGRQGLPGADQVPSDGDGVGAALLDGAGEASSGFFGGFTLAGSLRHSTSGVGT